MALGWLLCGAGAGLAAADPPNLVGVWTKAVKINVADPQSPGSSTQYDRGDMELVLTHQDGRTVKGTKTFNGKQQAVTCEIGGNDKIACKDESGVFQGDLFGTDEIAGTYSAGSENPTLSVLVLRRKR